MAILLLKQEITHAIGLNLGGIMFASKITERREFEQADGSEEIRFCLHEKDRIEISDEAGNFIITIQDDEHGRAEISILEGRATIYM